MDVIHARPDGSRRSVGLAAWALIALIGAWLVSSLYFVNIDFDDGYATIVNSQYFLGTTPLNFWHRGPAMGLLLVPAEWVAQWLTLHPLDVRPHHAVMALLHLGYLIGVWQLLAAEHGLRWPVLLAYAAAVPSFLFFSYAPFISHDIAPGLLLLLMLVQANRYLDSGSLWTLASLVLAGAVAALVKQTYGLFWVATALACTALSLGRATRDRAVAHRLFRLWLAAALSGVLAWVAYSWMLGQAFAETPFLQRPILQSRAIFDRLTYYGAIEDRFYQALYWRNLSAYGYLAMASVIPGLYFCLRSRRPVWQAAAIAWVILVVSVQSIGPKEVRYLGFLAPLTALIMVPALDFLLRLRRAYVGFLLLVLAVDASRATGEALRIADPFYRSSVSDFLADLPTSDIGELQIVLKEPLSFVAPDRYAFFRDRYHRITHLTPDELVLLYGIDVHQMTVIAALDGYDNTAIDPGDHVFFVNGMATRRPPWQPDNRPNLDAGFAQMHALAEQVTLVRVDDHYRIESPTAMPIMLLRTPQGSPQALIAREQFSVNEVVALRALNEVPDRLQLLGFRMLAMCNLEGCRRCVEDDCLR